MADVRTKSGVPVASDFNSSSGTPVVVNFTTGDGYVLKTGDVVTKIGAGTSDSSTLAAAATNIIPVDAAADTTTSVLLAGTATGSQAPLTDAGITYNASTNILATNLDGNVNGTVGATTPAAGSFTTLIATGTTTLATTLTGALRADAGVVSVGMVRTANVTPLLATGSSYSAAHSFGTVPFIAHLELVNITDEQGFVAGEVMQTSEQWNGAAVAGFLMWKNTTTVGVQLVAAYAIMGRHKTTGAAFTPTAANWAYRFVVMK